jgi:biopolymer transport protein ExbB/TolQ
MTTPTLDAAPDLSVLGLFLLADWVVRSVMISLLLASVVVWAVALDRALRFAALRRDAEALRRFAMTGQALPAGHGWAELLRGIAATMRDAATEPAAERRARTQEVARLAIGDRLREARRGLSLLAAIASTAPFIGLFGTVWGVMNAFTGIARSGNASLAAVAPGIAEALLATAVGLVAAIPAAFAYNRLATALSEVRAVAFSAVGHLSLRDAPLPAALREAAE